MVAHFFYLVLGLVLLVGGGSLLVSGAARIAALSGVPPLIIGLTVVAYGTSAPEMAVSVGSALSGSPDLAVSNVVGSNIFNVLFILGLAALIVPLVVQLRLIRVEVPLMVGASVLAWWMARDGLLSQSESTLLAAGAVLYTAWQIAEGRRASSSESREKIRRKYPLEPLVQALFIAAGLMLLVKGSDFLVSASTALARSFDVDESIIGLTIVAAGTSLPELATSAVAAFKGDRDIAVGNVVGSNLFNILAVLGLTGVLSPDGLQVSPGLLSFDMAIMIATAAACLPIFFTRSEISRWEGLLFLTFYISYAIYLGLDATAHAQTEKMEWFFHWFLLPAAVGIILVSSSRELLRSCKRKEQLKGS